MKALLVIDIQKGYIERYDECLLTRINQRIEYSVENSELIIYVKNIRKLRRGIKANKLTESLNVCSPYIVCKETASAFSNDELHDILTQNQVTEIDIVGIDGNSCIASSAVDAQKYGFNVTLLCDYIGVQNTERFEKRKSDLVEKGIVVL